MNFWFLVVSMIFVRSLDAYLTYLITPDLKFELNPLVSVGNQGWATLLSVNAFVVFFTLLLLYYSFNNSVHIYYPKEKNYTLKEFISFFLYNEKNSFYKIYFRVPYNRKVILNFCGYLFARVFTVWSVIIVSHNLLLLHLENYHFYSSEWNLWVLVYLAILPITFYFFWKFFRLEYRKYLVNARSM